MNMKPVSPRILVCFVIAVAASCLSKVSAQTYYPETYAMDDHCDDLIDVGIASLIRLEGPLSHDDCDILLHDGKSGQMVVSFTTYKVNWASDPSDCDKYVYFDLLGDGGYPFGGGGIFSYISNYDTGNGLIVEILVTTVQLKTNGTCPASYFDCHYKNYCINQSLTCNNYNDCGNNRDEGEVCGKGGGGSLATTTIIGIACGSAAFIVIVIISIVCFIKLKRRSDEDRGELQREIPEPERY